jgi:hypothetical protein
MKCITVKVGGKEKQFKHQFLYTGVGDERRCHFCQLTVTTLEEEIMEESYPGQTYFHEHNPDIKRAEEDYKAQNPWRTGHGSKS